MDADVVTAEDIILRIEHDGGVATNSADIVSVNWEGPILQLYHCAPVARWPQDEVKYAFEESGRVRRCFGKWVLIFI